MSIQAIHRAHALHHGHPASHPAEAGPADPADSVVLSHAARGPVVTDRRYRKVADRVRSGLTDDLRKPEYRGNPNPMAGHCYVASEALYHLLGGKAKGWTPMTIQHEAGRTGSSRTRTAPFSTPPRISSTRPSPTRPARGAASSPASRPGAHRRCSSGSADELRIGK